MIQAVNYPVNCGLANSTFSYVFAKQTVADRSFNSSYFLTQKVQTSGIVTQVQFNDSNILRDVGAFVVNDVNVTVTPINNRRAFVKNITSSNTNVLSGNKFNRTKFDYVSNGTSILTIELDTGEKQVLPVTVTSQVPVTADTFLSFVSGALIDHIYNSTASICNGTTTKPDHYRYYTTYDPTYVKNNNCWLKDFDMSGVCVKTGSGNTRMCTMITPYHAIGVKHASFHPQPGETVLFLGNNSVLVNRIVESISYVGNFDCSIIKFTQPVPETVKKYKFLPTNAINYLPTNRNIYNSDGSLQIAYQMYRCPIVIVSHYNADPSYPFQRNNRFVYVRDVDWATLNGAGYIYGDYSSWFLNYNGRFVNDTWLSPARGGDSGGPQFAIINNELIYLGPHITAFETINCSAFLIDIQNTINTLGPVGQTVQTVDLSEFTYFS